MSKYIINGGQSLKGEVSIRGAKNASFKQIIATLLTDEQCLLTNVPKISDVKITQSIATNLGSIITSKGEHGLEIETPSVNKSEIPFGTGQKSRTSFMFCAPLLIRTGKAIIPQPGGDKLGARPLDRLFSCLEKMNVKINEHDSIIEMSTTGLVSTEFDFIKPSHTVTETILMIACLTPGKSIFHSCAKEPEIDDLIKLLNSMGANITRTSNLTTITVEGVSKLHGTKHEIISDRNEAITFACAALATKGSISILKIDPKIIETFLKTIETMGAKVEVGKDEVTVTWVQPLKAINIETGPEPMFMTDWQPVFCLVLSQAIGCSTLIERVFPNRFQHIEEFKKMGLKIKYFNPEAFDPNYYEFNSSSDNPNYHHGVKIYGPTKLQPANFDISDLRTGASITLAALTAQGESIINGVEYIERGYENLAGRLCSLGANIKYIKT